MARWLDRIRQRLGIEPVSELLTPELARDFDDSAVEEESRLGLSIEETEQTFFLGSRAFNQSVFDRGAYDRQSVMEDCLQAWRFNPLARRIVELTTQYVIGGGMSFGADDAESKAFLRQFWQHPLNQMDMKLATFSDELTITGNLFLMLSNDSRGMSFVRVVPSGDVLDIHTRENDIEQELSYTLRGEAGEEPKLVPAWRANHLPTMQSQVCILHYAVNRPAGARWGESDLAPVLKWLGRYSAWLEDRVRLNHFRNAFVYVVKAKFVSENSRRMRQLQLAANPPNAGSILVCDESEEWSVLSPKLEALDASTDGLAIKKMIAAGVGLPLHFLAEPESSTKTTAESAGHPTYRRFEERQRVMCWILEDLLRVVLQRRAVFDRSVNVETRLFVRGGDIYARDNVELANAGHHMAEMALNMLDKGMIDEAEALRLVYRFIGEKLPEIKGS